MPAIIGAALAWLARIMSTRIGMWAVQLLLFLGIAIATQGFVIGPTVEAIKGYANGAGEAVVWLAYLNFDKALTMVCSAWVTKLGAQAARVALVRRTA